MLLRCWKSKFDNGTSLFTTIYKTVQNFASKASQTLLVGASVVSSLLVRSPSPSADPTRYGRRSHASAPLRHSFGPPLPLSGSSTCVVKKIQRETNMHSSTTTTEQENSYAMQMVSADFLKHSSARMTLCQHRLSCFWTYLHNLQSTQTMWLSTPPRMLASPVSLTCCGRGGDGTL